MARRPLGLRASPEIVNNRGHCAESNNGATSHDCLKFWSIPSPHASRKSSQGAFNRTFDHALVVILRPDLQFMTG